MRWILMWRGLHSQRFRGNRYDAAGWMRSLGYARDELCLESTNQAVFSV